MTITKKAIIYARHSGSKQITNPNESVATQIKTCRKYCKEHGIENTEIHIAKGSSGKNFVYLKEKINKLTSDTIIITTSFDRISRNIADYEYLKNLEEQGKIEVKIVEDNSNALPQQLTLMFAKQYRQDLSQSIKRGLEARKRRLAEENKN
jgi:DNA invertase Pin-like site-specific DNA recombinase